MCTNSFPIDGRGLYCTPRCRQRAFRLRHRQANQPTLFDLATWPRREQRLIDQTTNVRPARSVSLAKDGATDAICGVEGWDSAAAGWIASVVSRAVSSPTSASDRR